MSGSLREKSNSQTDVQTRSSLTRRWLIALVAIFAALAFRPAAADAPLTRLRNETRDLLRQEATLAEGPKRDAAATALCDMYVVIRNHERFATSEMLQGDATKIRRRLLSIARRNENRLRRAGVKKPSSLSSDVDSAISAALSDQTAFRDQLMLDDQTVPGAQGGGAIPDTGWQLVELIQRVVAPDFWDRQGGPGTIRYFAMRRVLVVRATTDVHEQIKDLLIALR